MVNFIDAIRFATFGKFTPKKKKSLHFLALPNVYFKIMASFLFFIHYFKR